RREHISDERKSKYGTTARNNTEPDSPYRLTSQKPAPGSGVEEDVPKDTRDVPFPIAYSARCIRRYSLGVIPTHCRNASLARLRLAQPTWRAAASIVK